MFIVFKIGIPDTSNNDLKSLENTKILPKRRTKPNFIILLSSSRSESSVALLKILKMYYDEYHVKFARVFAANI
jgi:hypothetical protein